LWRIICLPVQPFCWLPTYTCLLSSSSYSTSSCTTQLSLLWVIVPCVLSDLFLYFCYISFPFPNLSHFFPEDGSSLFLQKMVNCLGCMMSHWESLTVACMYTCMFYTVFVFRSVLLNLVLKIQLNVNHFWRDCDEQMLNAEKALDMSETWQNKKWKYFSLQLGLLK
jgi:hypothetical protein